MRTLKDIHQNYKELTMDISQYIASKIAESNANQDFQKVQIYGELGASISASDINKILNRLSELEGPARIKSETGRNIKIKITEGAIKQNYMSVTAAQNAGLMDSNIEYKILLPDGTSFKSDIVQNRFRERSKVAEFYRKFQIKADDIIELSQVDNTTFTISKL